MSATGSTLFVAEPPAHYLIQPPVVVDCSTLAGLIFHEPLHALALLTAQAPRRGNAAVKLGVVAAVQRSSLAPAVQMVPLSTPADEAARPNNGFAADAGATTQGLPVACTDGVVGPTTVRPQPSVGSSSSCCSVGGDGGGIVLQDLGCDSPAGQPLFRRLSFTLTAGCNVLVMGSTGSGKVRALVSPRCMAIVLRPPSLPP